MEEDLEQEELLAKIPKEDWEGVAVVCVRARDLSALHHKFRSAMRKIEKMQAKLRIYSQKVGTAAHAHALAEKSADLDRQVQILKGDVGRLCQEKNAYLRRIGELEGTLLKLKAKLFDQHAAI